MLPEDEQRQLQEIEQALYRDDPKIRASHARRDPRVPYERKLLQALLGVVIGIGLFAAGVVTHHVYLEAGRHGDRAAVPGVGGRHWQEQYVAGSGPASSGPGTKTATGAKHRFGQTWRARMMERMAERWRHRRATAGCRGGPGADTRVDPGGTASP